MVRLTMYSSSFLVIFLMPIVQSLHYEGPAMFIRLAKLPLMVVAFSLESITLPKLDSPMALIFRRGS